jgi:lysophospholipase L1-like esterase
MPSGPAEAHDAAMTSTSLGHPFTSDEHSAPPRSRRLHRVAVVRGAICGLAVVVLLASGLWVAAPAGAASEPVTYYLSMGDSLAQGFQPIGGPPTSSAAAGYNQGYADQLLKLAQDGGAEHLRLVKLGCGGETTASMIADSVCPADYDTGTQLGDAVQFLDEHPGQIAFITINIGVNDIFRPCEGDPACFIPQIATNLPHILNTLRQHAGPDVAIVGANYYNPSIVDWFDDPAAGEFAAQQIVMFNNFLESLFARTGTPVADVESAFAVTDFTTQVELKHVGSVPLSVSNVCTLTWICTGLPLGPDIHANTDGYRVMAEAFAAELDI